MPVNYFEVYAVYALEIDPPEGEEPVEWMLLTTEEVKNPTQARIILRWYTYRWRIEEYHKILKSGCKAESYRLKGNSMEVLLGFLTSIAAQLLRMTYLNRTEPEAPATSVLNETQLEVLKAVAMLYRRGQIEAMERAIKTLSQGLEDLVEEATRFKKD